MADPPARPGGGKILGQPIWVWGVGAVVVIGGYLYLRRKSGSSPGGKQGAARPAITSTTTVTRHQVFWRNHADWQGQPSRQVTQ